MAEFAADRGRIDQALATYKQQSFFGGCCPVFERALGLSLQNEPPQLSLAFANAWQQQNPDHVPAIFLCDPFGTQSARVWISRWKAQSNFAVRSWRWFKSDFDWDLSHETRDQSWTACYAQSIRYQNNPSLLVMKAGLLLQFQQPKAALVAINRALKNQPKSPAFWR